MGFEQSYPAVSILLGGRNVDLLSQHAAELAGKPDDACVTHFSVCPLADWCALNTTEEYRDKLELIEWSLQQIRSSPAIGPAQLKMAFSAKAMNRDQFNQLLAEIATAAACASRAMLLELEWKTGKKGRGTEEYDADVRSLMAGEPVNLEVTLRTDDWADDVSAEMGDLFDKDGNRKAEGPVAKSRRTLTERQWAT